MNQINHKRIKGDMEEKVNILIVDDEESIRKLLVLVCRKYGYETEEAKTGQEAMKKARERFFNVVLLDIKLPDMDGIELISLIKSKHPNTAVIMITGYASVENAVSALHGGASAYIIKPLDIDELLATVSDVLRKQRLVMENKRLLQEIQQELAERKKTEKALRESENRFKTLFEEAPDPMYTHSLKGEFIDGNKAAEKLVGYKREELIGKNILKAGLLPKKYVLYAGKLLVKSIAGKRTGPDEIELIRKDGKRVFVEINSLPIKLSGKRTVLAIVRDITERKKAEEEKARVSAFLESSLASAPEGVFLINKQGVFTYANSQFLELIDYKQEDIVGKTIQEVVQMIMTSDSAKIIQERAKKRLETGEPITGLEIEIITKNGKPIPVAYSVSGIRDEKGNVIGEVVFLEDITERKKTAEELREAHDYLDNMFNFANAPIIVWDTEERITRFNHAFEKLTGYTAREVIGQKLGMLFPETIRHESLNKIESTLKGECWGSIEISILCKDGSSRIILWNSANIYAENGRTLSTTIAQGQDITERKQSEEEVKKHLDRLKIYYEATIGRERRIIELKHEVNEVLKKLGEKNKYME